MEARVVAFSNRGILSVVQLATSDQNSFEYISSETAIKGGKVTVKEVSEGGDVNTLLVVNESDRFVFFMDGDILAGAKQNRVVNTSILLAPHTKTRIPVSCVEQGRWRRVSADFSSSDYVAPSVLRSAKAEKVSMHLREQGRFNADQGEVWSRVTLFQSAAGVQSPTSNLSDVYEQRRAEVDHLIKELPAADGANGVGIYIGKDLFSIDLFNRSEVYGEYFPKILRGLALEATLKESTDSVAEAEAGFRVLDLLDKQGEAEVEKFPAVGTGEERRFQLPGFTGFELGYETHRIHTALLKSADERRI